MYGNHVWKRRFAWICVLAFFLILVGSSASCTMRAYELSRDVESLAHRAQVAADAEDMLSYMKELESNLEKHGMTSGYSTPIFPTPANDMALLYESVNQIIERLEEVKDIPKSETAYQVALDDLRGTIRELEAPSRGVVITQYWPYLLLPWLLLVWPFVYLFKYS